MSTKKSQLKSHSHCVFQISYHIVFVTKYRRKCLTEPILKRLREILDDGRILKVVGIPLRDTKEFLLKSAYEAEDREIRIYEENQ